MITERTLRRWRKEALEEVQLEESLGLNELMTIKAELSKRILKMTQELLDQYLLRREK